MDTRDDELESLNHTVWNCATKLEEDKRVDQRKLWQ